VTRGWLCREIEHGGYTSKHWRVWRVCDACRSHVPRFGEARPHVRLPERHPLLRRYAEVGINPEYYGRGVVDAAQDKADATALVCAVLKNREPVRGRTKHVMMLDDANFRLEEK
jgi:hypothetical protein